MAQQVSSIQGSPRSVLTGATIGFFIGAGSVSLYGPTAHIFVQAMHLSPTQIGWLVGMPMLTGSLLRIPFGASVDHNGGRVPFLILLIASLVGIAGLYWMLLTLYPNHLDAHYYPYLLGLGALAGSGIATFSVGIGQVSYWYPRTSQGKALAIFGGLGDSSPGFVALILPIVIMVAGLWSGYLFSLIMIILGILFYYFWGKNAPYFQHARHMEKGEAKIRAKADGEDLFPAGGLWKSLVLSARHWRTWPLVWLYFTNFGGFLALTVWFPTFWKNYYHTTILTATILTASFSLLAAFIRIWGGALADRKGGEPIAAISLIILLVGAIVMTFSQMFWLTVIGELLVGAGMGINNGAVFKLVPHYVPDAVGGASGWVGGLGCLGGFAVPPLLGAFVDRFGSQGYPLGYCVYIGLAMVSLLLIWISNAGTKRWGKNLEHRQS
ncbi:MAG: MFS transporter [Acidithiobacillus sp.]|nr:MFS transporter [Acidithiobacillus sp.]